MGNVTYNLKFISPNQIVPNPNNPRGESEEKIYSDKEFARLKDSIYEFGVLVPLIVRPKPTESGKYILIDGERRWRAALETNRKVPVHVIEAPEQELEELRTTFQIHMLRKQWSRIAQARALRMIIGQVNEESGKLSKSVLFEEIQEKTGYTETQLKDLLRVLNYSNTVLDEVESNKSPLKYSHIVQIEASFIEQVEKIFPDLITKYGKKSIRDRMLNKVRKGFISSTRDLMDDLLPVFMQSTTDPQLGYLKTLLLNFIDDEAIRPQDILKKFELKYPISSEDFDKSIDNIKENIENIQFILNNLKYAQLKNYNKLEKELFSILDAFKTYLNKMINKLE